ncbi:hypothetical protein [Shimazuella alba]|uniref:Uncharacterized protein n=1 Tax=Shimazuella alba TaxID=2690964 RepID=A0A6I4VPD2_9BACL|nr:hypothetical protein [Shimazuella alba]MXQ52238.1 hypothetical protein [Shimazuella alba]
MNLTITIEEEKDVVREFITFIRTDDRYTFYSHAKYYFSPVKDLIKLSFTRGGMSGIYGCQTMG